MDQLDHPEIDYLYKDEVAGWQQQGVVEVHPAFSEAPDGEVSYIQLRGGRLCLIRFHLEEMADQRRDRVVGASPNYRAVRWVTGCGAPRSPQLHCYDFIMLTSVARQPDQIRDNSYPGYFAVGGICPVMSI